MCVIKPGIQNTALITELSRVTQPPTRLALIKGLSVFGLQM